ncbi:hypothetical protein BDQ17DRAFT_555105 [Cyathus striatus]|nr:hypothetical protein BDQ17DRAFT_555105 [Cyathus striatus]
MLVMKNPFFIIRLLFFALLMNITFLAVAFTSWNINSFISLSCMALASLEKINKNQWFSRVQVECVWILMLGLCDIGTAISITINNSMLACPSNEWEICASSALLVPVSWIRSFIFVTYFLTLFTAGVTHHRSYRNLWRTSIYSIKWFEGHSALERGDLRLYYLDDRSSLRTQHEQNEKNPEIAPWAESTKIRRGKDSPFQVADSLESVVMKHSDDRLPSLPPKLPTVDISETARLGSRFIEKFRESRTLSRSESPIQYGAHFTESNSPFPPTVQNHDLPIPLPRLSKWVRADALKGVDVHTIPCSPQLSLSVRPDP